MLSRVAGNFYWMGRYVERAKQISCLLLTQLNEMPEDSPDFISASWQGIFEILGVQENYKENLLFSNSENSSVTGDFLLADAYTVVDYLSFETHHPHSLLSCLSFVRENARQSREKIPSLMWPHINKTYLRFKEMSLKELWPYKILDLYKDIMEFSSFFQGLGKDAFYQDETAHFIRLGSYLERFQNVSAVFINHLLLAMRYKTEEKDLIGLLLRCSALDNYRQQRAFHLKLRPVSDFLIYSPKFPGSLKFCLNEIKDSLQLIQEGEALPAVLSQSLQELDEKLKKDAHLGQPLASFLNSLRTTAFQLGSGIEEVYLNSKEPKQIQLENQ